MCVVIPDCTSCKILKVKIRMDYSTVVPFHKEFLKNIFREIYL